MSRDFKGLENTPWRVMRDAYGNAMIFNSKGYQIAQVRELEGERFAEKMAAAPELERALKIAISYVTPVRFSDDISSTIVLQHRVIIDEALTRAGATKGDILPADDTHSKSASPKVSSDPREEGS